MKNERLTRQESTSLILRRAVSRILCLSLTFIYRNLPPGIGRAALICRYIWSCRPGCRTRQASPTAVVGSYPAFSPLPLWAAVILCYGLRKIAPPCAFRSQVPCPVRTFLTPKPGRDRQALRYSAAKISKNPPPVKTRNFF